MKKPFIVSLYNIPDYWENFLHHCNDVARWNDRDVKAVIENELKPHGKIIDWCGREDHFLSWEEEKYHTLFVLRWS